jgi:hypothetical protein
MAHIKVMHSVLALKLGVTVSYDPRVGLNILLLDEASSIDIQPLMPSTKILQWQLRQNLQCKGVVSITTTIEWSKMRLEYHVFHHPGPTFIVVGVPLRALLRGTDNSECLKMAVGHQEFSTCDGNHSGRRVMTTMSR